MPKKKGETKTGKTSSKSRWEKTCSSLNFRVHAPYVEIKELSSRHFTAPRLKLLCAREWLKHRCQGNTCIPAAYEEFQWYSELLHDIETGVNSGPTFSVYTVTYYSNHGRNQKIANGTESRKDFFDLTPQQIPHAKAKALELRVMSWEFASPSFVHSLPPPRLQFKFLFARVWLPGLEHR